MCRLIESICVWDGVVRIPEYHQKRIDFSRFSLFGIREQLSLNDLISEIKLPQEGKFKLRLVYAGNWVNTDLIPYQIRHLKSFQIIEKNQIDYSFKKEDRSELDKLKKLSEADEIIISKNGFLTDTTFSNLVFWDGENWLTPRKPLLKGVMRSRLLDLGKIVESDISVGDLNQFSGFKLINAMMDLDESPFLDISLVRK